MLKQLHIELEHASKKRADCCFFLDIYMLVFYLFGNNQLAGKSLALLNKNMSLF